MIRRDILCEHDYLHIPVIPGGQRCELQIWNGGELVLSPLLALTDEGGEYFFLDVKSHRGQVLTFFIPEDTGRTERCLARIECGPAPSPSNPLYPVLYHEALRPAFHFSSRRGWLNDPNGLVYHDGIFHLYYQHNPLGTPHGGVNICWGHAVSTDLLCWQEKDDAIRPWVRDWSIASGSAVVDYENRAGYGKDAIIAAFTVLGAPNTDPKKPGYPSGGQYLAASTDGGQTFFRFSHEATVPTCNGEGWRDPRLFWYEDHYVMAVYETDEDGKNCVSFYVSEDFHTWRRTSRNADLYECPDIFPLSVMDSTGTEQTFWVLYGADGMARIGAFDGYHFTESGLSNPLDYGSATYAGQTWSHHPEGKRVHTSWVRGMGGVGEDLGYENMPFSQCMTIPAEIFLRYLPAGLTVCRRPVSQIKSLVQEILDEDCFLQTVETSLPMHHPALYEVRLTGINTPIALRAGEHIIRFDSEDGKLSFENGHSVLLNPGELSFTLLADTTTMEFCFADSIMATYSMYPEFMSLIVKGSCRVHFRCHAVKSIWDRQ
ncbi:MAG: glycoside hydrolase family 32 protein [Eubacteriales bacterium]|nr:glycoside hydrolase family 32 protein [Eubacteriales bacterium]